MPQMSPEEMQAMQQQAGGGEESAESGGSVSKMVQDIGQGLSELMKVIDKSPSSTDQDRQNASDVMKSYMNLVEGLGQESGQDAPPPEQADQGSVPAEGGLNGVPMGPQTKQ